MRPVIILRPEPGASETAARARKLGLQPRLCPLFEARPVSWDAPPPERFDALLMTSAQAARLGGSQLVRYQALPAYAVGSATAQAMAEHGFATFLLTEVCPNVGPRDRPARDVGRNRSRN